MSYSKAFDADVKAVANALKVQNPEWLKNLIQAESSWNPTAFNAGTGATGLIQFLPRTMKALGLISTEIGSKIPSSGALTPDLKEACRRDFLQRYPSTLLQLKGPVLAYLKQYSPFPTEQSLYLAVFYPAYRKDGLDTAFPAGVAAANPGIDTVGDYVNFVKKAGEGLAGKLKTPGGMAGLLIAAIGVYLLIDA